MDDLLERVHDLRARGEPFALATVVRVERPASARPGMKAIIYSDGRLEGWVGGSCAHPIVVREALQLLREGAPRLVRLSPHAREGEEQEGVIAHPMMCHSGGSLDIYVEPVLPRPVLLVAGEAPLVRALAALGRLAGFAVWAADDNASLDAEPVDAAVEQHLSTGALRGRITPSTYVVVATMGANDEGVLEQVVGAGAAYVGLVASRRRAASALAALRDRGADEDALRRVKAPAGLDIGAVTPEEIAVSIMAEIIHVRRSRTVAAAAPLPRQEAIDPICGMTVEVATAAHTFAHGGVTFYFCSAHCRQMFAREPARYVTAGA